MDLKALYSISYGLYVIASEDGHRINGQIANTVFQISNDPPTIAISINKKNLTHEFIKKSALFTVSVLSQEAPLSLIGQFGFKSGRDVDKFTGVNYRTTPEGLPYLVDDILAFIEARVIQNVDAGTHSIFVGEITQADVLKQGNPMTYAYYHQVKKGSTPPSAPTYIKVDERRSGMDIYECTICGYEYDPRGGDPENGIEPGTPFEELPDDWVCPVCSAGKDAFEKIS
ncbi:MAG: High molecular weight rubredoxin [Firmicutes bacterium]|jgi:flavin reductase (DIM6/NTAB) family NADH-FMN oxidoreductase RutF/rubredoxin|nr:High molecular weight rubredoxin [Bacillota bacterium]